MRRYSLLIGFLFLALGLSALGAEVTRFRIEGAEVALGEPAEVRVVIADAPEGVKALEGKVLLSGAKGHIEEVSSPYAVQVIAKGAREVRFRWLDLAAQVERGSKEVEFLSVTVIPEEVGEIGVSLEVPFLATDTGARTEVRVEEGTVKALPVANLPPEASPDSASTDEDVPVEIPVLANDVDPEGELDPASLEVVSPPSHGEARPDPSTGQVLYLPAHDFSGTDSFSYRICDTGGLCDVVEVTLEVRPVNDPPVARDDHATTEPGVPVTIDVLANDSDPEGALDPGSIALTRLPEHGTAEARGGKVVYTPSPGFAGTDSFGYTVRDREGAVSDEATVTVEVRGAVPSMGRHPSLELPAVRCHLGATALAPVRLLPGEGGIGRIEARIVSGDPELLAIVWVGVEGVPHGLWEAIPVEEGIWAVRLADPLGLVGPDGVEIEVLLDPRGLGEAELGLRGIRGLDSRGRPFVLEDTSVTVTCGLEPLAPGRGWGEPRDLDGDGALTLHDAFVLAFYFDRPPLSLVPQVADFDGDGALTLGDARALARLAAP